MPEKMFTESEIRGAFLALDWQDVDDLFALLRPTQEKCRHDEDREHITSDWDKVKLTWVSLYRCTICMYIFTVRHP